MGGGLLAGVGDITFAFVVSALRGVGPVRVLQSVAGGLLGTAARDGGLATAALGAVLHFFIAFVWAAVYWLASRRLRVLVQHPFVCGLLYGVAVYFFMYFVVAALGRLLQALARPRTCYSIRRGTSSRRAAIALAAGVLKVGQVKFHDAMGFLYRRQR